MPAVWLLIINKLKFWHQRTDHSTRWEGKPSRRWWRYGNLWLLSRNWMVVTCISRNSADEKSHVVVKGNAAKWEFTFQTPPESTSRFDIGMPVTLHSLVLRIFLHLFPGLILIKWLERQGNDCFGVYLVYYLLWGEVKNTAEDQLLTEAGSGTSLGQTLTEIAGKLAGLLGRMQPDPSRNSLHGDV